MVFRNILLIGAAILGLCTTACSDNDDDIKGPVDSKFTNALTALYPQAKDVEWERDGAYITADFSHNFQDIEVWFDQNAKWCMTETDYGKDFFMIPPVVNAAFAESEYSSWTVDDISFYERPDIKFYVIEVEQSGNPDTDIYYTPEGKLIKVLPNDRSHITPTSPILL